MAGLHWLLSFHTTSKTMILILHNIIHLGNLGKTERLLPTMESTGGASQTLP